MELIYLPIEILIDIFNKLYVGSLQSLSVSCRYFNNIINRPKKYLGIRRGAYVVGQYTLEYRDNSPIVIHNYFCGYYINNSCIKSKDRHTDHYMLYNIDGYIEYISDYNISITSINRENIDTLVKTTGDSKVVLSDIPCITSSILTCINMYLGTIHIQPTTVVALNGSCCTVHLKLPDIVIDLFIKKFDYTYDYNYGLSYGYQN